MFNNRLVAAVDIGSHNCRLQIAKKSNKKINIIHNYSKQISLVENLAFNNEFEKTKINDLLDILKIISQKMSEFGVSKYRCIATEAFRQSINSNEVIDEIKKYLNLKVEIISVQEEAELCLKGCEISLQSVDKPWVVFDIGGGSTEIILCKNTIDKIPKIISLSVPYGVVNIEDYFHLFSEEKVKFKINREFKMFYKQQIEKLERCEFIGSCATVTTVYAIYHRLSKYDKKKVEGKILKINEILSVINYLKKMNISENKYHSLIGRGKNPLLYSGIFILELILKNFELENLYVLENKVRLGILEEL